MSGAIRRRWFQFGILGLLIGAAAGPAEEDCDAREFGQVVSEREETTRRVPKDNLKRLMLAIHQYHDANGALPAAFTCKDRKPLLSWRVTILPWLGKKEEVLYREFRLDESWGSDQNSKLIAKMPEVYVAPVSDQNEGKTVYLTPRVKRTGFPGEKALKLASIPDGTSNTIAIVEVNADRAVPWTKPEDWTFDPDNESGGVKVKSRLKAALNGPDPHHRIQPDFFGNYSGGFYVAFFDGSVRFIPENTNDAIFKLMFMRDDRTPFDMPEQGRRK